MPVLKNTKHEKFAQELAKGNTADKAYVLAGYPKHRGNAATLRAKQSILDRVIELQSVVAERTELTIEGLIEKFDRVHKLSLAMGQLSAANGALTAMAKLAGLWIEKSENTNTNRNVDPDSLTDEQLAYIASQGLADDTEEASGPDQLN